MKAEKCPVCGGSGKYVHHEEPGHTTTGGSIPQPCHGCGGKGWVEVGDGTPSITIYPYPPPTTPWPTRPNDVWYGNKPFMEEAHIGWTSILDV